MTRKRRVALPAPDDNDFLGEPSGPVAVSIQSEAEFFKEAAEDVEDFRTGTRTDSVVSIAFESIGVFLEVLTPKRSELLDAVRRHGTFDSIESLSGTLSRNRAAVSRDLRALSDAGLLRVVEAVHAGHGRRSEISLVAKKLVVSLSM